MTKRYCRVRTYGPLLVMKWTPKLGEGRFEKRRRPRRYTFGWDWGPWLRRERKRTFYE